MPNLDDLITDYCIVGFPKCGTTAVARLMDDSPACHLARMNGRFESPYFTSNVAPSPDYVPGKVNGHKHSAYAFSIDTLVRIDERNPDTLMIFCIRDLAEVLLSWHAMHRRIAESGRRKDHFAVQPEVRDFYMTCDVNAYFEHYARHRLAHGKKIETFLNRCPGTRSVFVSQARLAMDAGEVMRRIHQRLGVDEGDAFYAGLPRGYVSPVAKDVSSVAPHVRAFVLEQNHLIMQQLARLAPERNLTLYSEGATRF